MMKRFAMFFLVLLLVLAVPAIAQDTTDEVAEFFGDDLGLDLPEGDTEEVDETDEVEIDIEIDENGDVEVDVETDQGEVEVEVDEDGDVEVDVEISDEILEEAGVTPDSFLWGVDRALDNINLALSTNPEKKARKGLLIAQERLAEISAMGAEGKIGPMKKAEEAHGEVLADVEESIEDIEGDTAEEELEIQEELEDAIDEHSDRVTKVKIHVIGELTEEDQALLDELLANLEGQAASIEVKVQNAQGKSKVKLTQTGGPDRDDNELEIEIEDDEESENKGKDNAKDKGKDKEEVDDDEVDEENEEDVDEVDEIEDDLGDDVEETDETEEADETDESDETHESDETDEVVNDTV